MRSSFKTQYSNELRQQFNATAKELNNLPIKVISHYEKLVQEEYNKYPSKSFAAFRRGNALCLPRFGQGQALPLRKSLKRSAAEFLLTYLDTVLS